MIFSIHEFFAASKTPIPCGPMKHFETVEDFVAQSKAVSTIDELADSFQRSIGQLGFEAFALTSCSDFGGSLEKTISLGRYPRAWHEHYVSQRYFESERIFDAARVQQLPFTWDAPLVQTGITERQRRIFTEASEVGLRYGISVPIHVWGHSTWVASVAGPLKIVDPATVPTIHLMAMYLYQATSGLTEEFTSTASGKVLPMVSI